MVQTDGRIALFQNGHVGWGHNKTHHRCVRIVQSCSPAGANVHPHYGSMGAHASLPTITNGIAIGSSVLLGIIGLPITQTTERATSVAMGRICAMHAM